MEKAGLAKGHQRTVAQNSLAVLQSSKTFLTASKPGFRSSVKKFRCPTLFPRKVVGGDLSEEYFNKTKDQKGPSKQKKPKLDRLGRNTFPLNKFSVKFLSWGVVAKCC